MCDNDLTEEEQCFLELLQFMVAQGMVDFTGVSREQVKK